MKKAIIILSVLAIVIVIVAIYMRVKKANEAKPIDSINNEMLERKLIEQDTIPSQSNDVVKLMESASRELI